MNAFNPTFLLRGIAGSTSHGLAGPDSDEDLHGVFAWPTPAFFFLNDPPESLTGHDPQDYSYHELKKFLKLALKSNPTVLELLWLDSYLDVEEDWGDWLISRRFHFLSKKAVHAAYGGYAYSQFEKLQRRGDTFSSETSKRTAKHARHLFRLLEAGTSLLQTGTMTVKVADPQRYHDIAEMTPEQWIDLYNVERPKFEYAAEVSTLPEQPDTNLFEKFLSNYRESHL